MCPTGLFLPPVAATVGMEADGVDAAPKLGYTSLSPFMLFCPPPSSSSLEVE
jgi:hypothetical protein